MVMLDSQFDVLIEFSLRERFVELADEAALKNAHDRRRPKQRFADWPTNGIFGLN